MGARGEMSCHPCPRCQEIVLKPHKWSDTLCIACCASSGLEAAKRQGYLAALGDVAEAVNESFANWGGPQRENFDVIVNFVWDFYEKAKSRAGKEGEK